MTEQDAALKARAEAYRRRLDRSIMATSVAIISLLAYVIYDLLSH